MIFLLQVWWWLSEVTAEKFCINIAKYKEKVI